MWCPERWQRARQFVPWGQIVLSLSLVTCCSPFLRQFSLLSLAKPTPTFLLGLSFAVCLWKPSFILPRLRVLPWCSPNVLRLFWIWTVLSLQVMSVSAPSNLNHLWNIVSPNKCRNISSLNKIKQMKKDIEQKPMIFLNLFKHPNFLSSYLHQQFGAHPACSFSMHWNRYIHILLLYTDDIIFHVFFCSFLFFSTIYPDFLSICCTPWKCCSRFQKGF